MVAVAPQPATEPDSTIGLDPDRVSQERLERAARSTNSLEYHELGRLYLSPLFAPRPRPTGPAKPRALVLRKRLEYFVQEPRPPIKRVIRAGEIIGVHDRGASQLARQTPGEGTLACSAGTVDRNDFHRHALRWFLRANGTSDLGKERVNDQFVLSPTPSLAKSVRARLTRATEAREGPGADRSARRVRLLGRTERAVQWGIHGCGALAQLGERRLCKPEVTGSIPVRSMVVRTADLQVL